MKILAAALVLLVLTAVPVAAEHQQGHTEPAGPAKWAFADDFPLLLDSEWGFEMGGFGGIERRAPRQHVPVIFVHGNNVDHADWYLVRDDLLAAGWTDQEMYALSYNGVGITLNAARRVDDRKQAEHAEMGGDGVSRVTANDINVPDLVAFIRAVQDYTGSDRFSIVSHSLGVTLARKALLLHPELAADLVAFVGIAGANHGTSFCPPGSEGQVHSCDEIAKDTPWLEELNGPNDELETYGATQWMTIRDGTGTTDSGYTGPDYADSPILAGADNREFPYHDHHELRVMPGVVTAYREFLEAAEAAVQPSADPEPPRSTSAPASDVAVDGDLPASGGGTSLAILLALAVGVGVRRRPRDDG
ncbi:MAG: hypothetical protein R3249_10725 [Nitriliruptorales bacterium]|nr:hypothetical protein [Nitriliruptorales bacterium]